jgi:hypothetical protein
MNDKLTPEQNICPHCGAKLRYKAVPHPGEQWPSYRQIAGCEMHKIITARGPIAWVRYSERVYNISSDNKLTDKQWLSQWAIIDLKRKRVLYYVSSTKPHQDADMVQAMLNLLEGAQTCH